MNWSIDNACLEEHCDLKASLGTRLMDLECMNVNPINIGYIAFVDFISKSNQTEESCPCMRIQGFKKHYENLG